MISKAAIFESSTQASSLRKVILRRKETEVKKKTVFKIDENPELERASVKTGRASKT